MTSLHVSSVRTHAPVAMHREDVDQNALNHAGRGDVRRRTDTTNADADHCQHESGHGTQHFDITWKVNR